MFVGILALTLGTPARALEVAAGDYEVYPAGVNIGVLYYQYFQTSDFYVNGTKVSSDFDLKFDIGLLRYIRPIKLTNTATVDLNVILPFGKIGTSGDAGALSETSGVGDLIIGAPIKILLDPATKDAFSIGPFLYLPTGSYDQNKHLNLGAHRWKALLQLAYVKHFDPTWALDVLGDVQVSGKNDKLGPNELVPAQMTLKEAARYEAQAHLRYILSPATALSVGLGHYWGAEHKLNGVSLDDKLSTTYGRLTATHFIDQTTQFQIQLGKDLSVDNGPKEGVRLNLRLVKIF